MSRKQGGRRERAGATPAEEPEQVVRLREHVYRITSADDYFDVMRRIRHARYALDSVLGGSRIYSKSADVEALLVHAAAFRAKFDELEDWSAAPKRDGERVARGESELDPAEFEARTRAQIELWQDVEELLARLFAEMAGSLEGELLASDGRVPELAIYVSLMRFHHGKRMDTDAPLRTYIFDLGVDAPFEIDFADHVPQRQRNEQWYDEVLDAMARYADAARREEESALLKRHTRIMTGLTVIIAILTAVMTYAAFAG